MSKAHGKDTYVAIDNTSGQPKDVSSNITSIDGMPGERELVEITALGDAARTWAPSLKSTTVTLEGYWDEAATTGTDTLLGTLYTHTGALTLIYGPEGNSTGDIQYNGEFFVRNYTITSRMGEIVTFRAEFQSNSAITRAIA